MAEQPPAMQSSGRNTISSVATMAAGALILWLFVIYSVSLLTLYSGLGIWQHTATVSLAFIPIWVLFARDRRANGGLWPCLLAVFLAAAVLASAYWLAGSFVDVSWDGTAYHQQAILYMVERWSDFPARPPASVMYYQQLDHYPKAPWVLAASIYQAGTDLEAAKLLQFVLIAAALLLLFGALARLQELPLWMAALVALTAALSPVAIYQSLSFYVDGQLGSLLVATIGLTLLMLQGTRRRHLVLLAALIILTINTKQTGVLYAGCLVIALLALVYGHDRKRFVAVLSTAALAGTLASAAYGFSPYVTNAMNFGNPFYPILGRNDADFEKGHRPPGFDQRSGANRLFLSTFSEPTVAINSPPVLRVPFSLTQEEKIRKFRGADIRLGGWGVLFSGALTLSVLALPLLWLVPPGPRRVGLVLLAAVVVSVLANPEAWWARFAPHWCLAALIPAALLLLARKLVARLVGLAIVSVLLVNSGLVAYTYYPKQREHTTNLSEYLQLIVDVGMPIHVYFGAFPSNRIRLREAGIQFEEVADVARLPCREPHPIFPWQGAFCVFGEQ